MNVLITGAASGIGYDLARVLAYRCHQVYACCHTEASYEKRKDEETPYLHFRKLDITKIEDLSILEEIPFDCIVNHAGIAIGGRLIDRVEEGKLEENFEVNVWATMRLIARYIKDCQKENRPGKVLITSSLAGYFPLPYLGCYVSTKTTLTMLSQILRWECKLENLPISVKLIQPGAYHTGFNQLLLSGVKEEKMYQKGRKLFALLEQKETHTIVNKMVKAIETSSSKFLYRAPCYQAFLTKCYQIFSKV